MKPRRDASDPTALTGTTQEAMPKYKYCLVETVVTEYSVTAPDDVQAVSISERCGGSPTGRRKVISRKKSVGFPPMEFDETVQTELLEMAIAGDVLENHAAEVQVMRDYAAAEMSKAEMSEMVRAAEVAAETRDGN